MLQKMTPTSKSNSSSDKTSYNSLTSVQKAVLSAVQASDLYPIKAVCSRRRPQLRRATAVVADTSYNSLSSMQKTVGCTGFEPVAPALSRQYAPGRRPQLRRATAVVADTSYNSLSSMQKTVLSAVQASDLYPIKAVCSRRRPQLRRATAVVADTSYNSLSSMQKTVGCTGFEPVAPALSRQYAPEDDPNFEEQQQ